MAKKKKLKIFKKENNKSLVYLFLLLATIVGLFFLIAKITNQSLSLNLFAKEKSKSRICKKNGGYFIRSKGNRTYQDKCNALSKKNGGKDIRKFTYNPVYSDQKNGYICCVATKVDLGKDCKQAGGTDWYKSEEEIINGYNKKYKVTIEDKTSNVGQYYKDQHKNRKCLYVEAKLKPTCESLKGIWKKDNCNYDEGDKYYYTPTFPNGENLADYKSGFMCCKKGALLPKPTKKKKKIEQQ